MNRAEFAFVELRDVSLCLFVRVVQVLQDGSCAFQGTEHILKLPSPINLQKVNFVPSPRFLTLILNSTSLKADQHQLHVESLPTAL